ncbi:DUF1684 domain-containing protein [bacterium]|nr:MAG: DUF1684 domain-containing protein [bacterium]
MRMPDDDERAETKGGLPMDYRKGGWPWKVRIMIPVLMLLCLMCLQAQKNVDKWLTEEAAWRAGRDREMRSEESWLTISGLFWLDEGENTFGSSSSNRIELPPGSAPSLCGKFIRKGAKITVEAAPGVTLFCGGKQVVRMELRAGDSTSPDILALGGLRIWVIRRGDRYAVRLRDLKTQAFKDYSGLDYFPPSTAFRIEAGFVPYSVPKSVKVEAKIVKQSELVSPGTVKFSLEGKEYKFIAFDDEERGTYFLVFGDETNGMETYDGGRFLDFKIEPSNKVVLNFNRAYNPPCAFSDYATCPLPPAQNRFPFRLEAGEKKYNGHD